MNKNEKEYYGIYLNKEIPKLDKVNKFSKEVEIEFEGKAFLITRDDEGEVEEIMEIENHYKLKKEDDYEIEFINDEGMIFDLKIRIRMSWLIILLLLFLFGFIIGMILCTPKSMKEQPLARFYNFINLAVLQLDIDKKQEEQPKQQEMTKITERKIITPIRKEIVDRKEIIDTKEEIKPIEKQYNFDVDYENIASNDIKLSDSISAEAVAKNKIAPGVSGSFSIIINTKNSSVDMNYYIKFQDIVKDKPNNMNFKIRGKKQVYSTLQELEKELTGIIEKQSTEEIIIDWEWLYENGQNEKSVTENDLVDTNDGKNLESYKFKIMVEGEEAI